MVNACREADVLYLLPITGAHYRCFLKVKELLDNGSIGDIRFVATTQYSPMKIFENEPSYG